MRPSGVAINPPVAIIWKGATVMVSCARKSIKELDIPHEEIDEFLGLVWIERPQLVSDIGSLAEVSIHFGDFLQYLPFILKNKTAHYIVATHFRGAPSFFKSLNIQVDQYYFYSNKEEYRAIRNLIRKHDYTYVCPRALFFKASPFGNPVTSKHTKRKTIGIHAGASSLGSHKAIPADFTRQLLKYLDRENFKIILFGTKNELTEFQGLKNKGIVFASDKNIIKNLALVEHCDFFIGSDSVFKTMASMLKKPTIVLHQNIKNNFRDRVFITPYIKEQLMYVYKYTNFNKTDTKSALQFISNVMNLKLNNS